MKLKQFTCLFLMALPFISLSQSKDTVNQTYRLADVTVTATRIPSTKSVVPISITKLDSSLMQLPYQNLSIKERLKMVPGVYVQNAYNFAQDARISIRGFGATAAFGIRGIKLIVDGIPETTPDGTGQLDNLNLDLISRMEVIRGPASSLYGNASGGVILINSDLDFTQNFVHSQSISGSYGYYSQAISAGMKIGSSNYVASVRTFGSDGYRANGEFHQVNSRLAMKHSFNDQLNATFLAEYVTSPQAQDAGGLTLEEVNDDRAQARENNLTYDAGEAINQIKFGSHIDWILDNAKTIEAYGFYNRRKFDGKQPFEDAGIIDLKRDYVGHGANLNVESNIHKIKIGYDLLLQSDNRKRYHNLDGKIGDLSLDQIESFQNLGIYVLDHIQLANWFFSLGLRQDLNWLTATDHFLLDGDDTGTIQLNNLNYNIGISRFFTEHFSLFANHATNFETPTLNQLSNRPDNSGGFENLEAATATSYEMGMKWTHRKLKGELVGFIIETDNELVPYELEAFPERTFYRNAGSTARKGIELSIHYASRLLDVFGTYSYADYKYGLYLVNDQSLNGMNMPGIPQNHAMIGVVSRPVKGFELELETDYVSSLFADDENDVKIEGYVEHSVSLRYRRSFNQWNIAPFLGIQNFTDETYFDNIRINAFGGRFYEPAPLRNYYFGVNIGLE